MDKATLKRRLKAAQTLSKKLMGVSKALNKTPCFGGKAALMDKVHTAIGHAANLDWNLFLDLQSEK